MTSYVQFEFQVNVSWFKDAQIFVLEIKTKYWGRYYFIYKTMPLWKQHVFNNLFLLKSLNAKNVSKSKAQYSLH